MKKLAQVILSFDNWTQPGTLYNFVLDSELLDENTKLIFREMWEKANSFDIWKFSDLILSCKASQKLLADNYYLEDNAIANIVRAISYQWK